MNMNEITIMIIYLIDMINEALSRLLGRLGLLRVKKMKTLFFGILQKRKLMIYLKFPQAQ